LAFKSRGLNNLGFYFFPKGGSGGIPFSQKKFPGKFLGAGFVVGTLGVLDFKGEKNSLFGLGKWGPKNMGFPWKGE